MFLGIVWAPILISQQELKSNQMLQSCGPTYLMWFLMSQVKEMKIQSCLVRPNMNSQQMDSGRTSSMVDEMLNIKSLSWHQANCHLVHLQSVIIPIVSIQELSNQQGKSHNSLRYTRKTRWYPQMTNHYHEMFNVRQWSKMLIIRPQYSPKPLSFNVARSEMQVDLGLQNSKKLYRKINQRQWRM